ncbi:MAG: methionyl-tRNA formyltransferase [Bacilli bacterium]|nr:methionyl-tRNA formyltransferase [Bacilli bacterium]
MKDIKVVFMGTPSFAVPVLEKLIENYNVIMVVCQPDRAKDKKGNIIYPPIKELALKNNIEVYQPLKLSSEYEYIIEKNPDIIITCAYGQILPSSLLDYPKYGCINVHGSLLPRLRGGAPIHHAIINGDKETGITIMYMDKKMDAGDIISQRSLEIKNTDNLDSIYSSLSTLGSELLIETLPSIINGTNNRIKQNENEVTFGYNISKEDELINFNDSAINIFNKVRGLCSIPGASCYYNGKRLKIYEVEVTNKLSKDIPGKIVEVNKDSLVVTTKDYLIKIKDIKLEGKKRCMVSEYLNGIHDKSSLLGGILTNE